MSIQLMPSVAIAYASEEIVINDVQMEGPSDGASDADGSDDELNSVDLSESEKGATDDTPEESGEPLIEEEPVAEEGNESSSGAESNKPVTSEVQSTDGEEASEEGDESDEVLDLAKFANSWRFSDGVPSNAISTFAKASNVTWTKENGVYIGSNGMRVEGASAFGIDVSQWNGDIDWAKVKASGVDYAIIRVGYGGDTSSQDDPYFFEYVNGARAAGLDIGVYIYSYGWDAATGKSEAQHVLRLLRSAGLSPSDLAYPVYYDLEQESKSGKGPCGIDDKGNEKLASNSDLLAMTKAFASTIESAGYDVGVYANLNWWNNYLTSSEYNQWDRWVAQYNTQCDYAGEYSMWQCMSNGAVNGISGSVDINFYYGDCKTGLVWDDQGLKFRQEDGSFLVSSWKEWDGHTYYFGEDGYALRWSQDIDGKRYYFNGSSQMVTGWLTWG
ncbi:GH25 family lysozyme, partial [uncultured Slackia sp.]|uniref:GH25 family lysozyme n=1 Tax=uncultured Slackia sp. TaxID=665903 RepID=UPI0025DD274D